ncbi:GlcNAc-transferase family protein [Pseudomonadota bacterium]
MNKTLDKLDYTKEDTIFVQIASYRDHELQYTLQDLFKKAKRPENIFVGICHQYDMKSDEDKRLFEVPFPRQEQLRIDEVDYRESLGCCWARHRVQKLYKDEKWTLMIDAHTRFEPDWDEFLVSTIKKLKPKTMLTAYAAAYTKQDLENYRGEYEKKDNLGAVYLFFDAGTIRCNAILSVGDRTTAAFCAHAGFAAADIIKEIPYDPNLFFLGEEPNIAARAFTKGWELRLIDRNILYHFYNADDVKKEKKINTHAAQDALSKKRTRHLFNMQKSNDPEVLQEIEKYGLGTKRTLRDYERFSGIDFRRKTLRERTKGGVFDDWEEVSKTKDLKSIFDKVND